MATEHVYKKRLTSNREYLETYRSKYVAGTFSAGIASATPTDCKEPILKERFLEISQRFYPFLSKKGGYVVYRPMLFLNDEEMGLVTGENSLPVLSTPCRYSQMRPKKVLGGHFRTFGYRFEHRQVLAIDREYLSIAHLQKTQEMTREEYLTRRF